MVVAEISDGQTSGYIYGNDLIAQIDPTANPAFYHQDGLGSVRALSSAAGQRTAAYGYDAFGTVRSHIGGASQSFGFAGEQMDGELGVVYLRARYYDPRVGRFLTLDPVPGTIIDPRSLNRYVYSQNNPVVLTDPNGEAINLATGAIGAGAGAVVNSAWYMVADVSIRGEDFSGARLAGKAASGAVTGGLAGVSFGGSAIASGPIRGAGGYVVEHTVENLLKHDFDLSRIGEGMSVSGVIGDAVFGGVGAGILTVIEGLPGYLKPTLDAPVGQLSLFDNTYGATIREVVGYEISKKLVGKFTKYVLDPYWKQFERNTRYGLVRPVFAPTQLSYQTAHGGSWGGPPGSAK